MPIKTKILKKVEDVKDVKMGDPYIIDIFPDPKNEDQTITPEMMRLYRDIVEAIDAKMLTQNV